MKKLVKYICLVLIMFIIGGCRENKIFKIGISQCSYDDWREKMNEEVILESMLHDDVEVEIRSANDDSNQQIKDLEYFVHNDFDVIVVSPNEAENLTPVIKKIHEKGIPVIIFDRNIKGDSYTQYIGVDNIDLGKSAGEYSSMLLSKGIKAIEIYGLPGSTPAIDRSKGFNDVMDSIGGVVLGIGIADWRQDKAESLTDSLLRLYPETNLIFAHNDRMALGARKSLDKAGREDIKIIGIDAAPNIGIKGVSEGKLTATFLYPTAGDVILQEAIKIAKGEDFDRVLMLPTTSAVDASNADILLLQNETIESDTDKVLSLRSQLDDYINLHRAQQAVVWLSIAIVILLFGVLFLVLRTFWSHKRHQYALLQQNKLLQEERDKQKELNEMLQEATQSKLVFFTNVSHDLRTPLTLIAEPVAQLKEAKNLDIQQKTLIKIADKNVHILQRLINQILDFRKFESNKLTLNLKEIDFSKVIIDWLESFQAVAKKRDIRLLVDSPQEDIQLAIDPEKMERVFFNLVYNAIKYSPNNSDITVRYRIEGSNLVLQVIDQGEGISKENLPFIFDSFYQVDRVKPKGSGIGLFLAKAFVELHEGTLTVESELNKGSIFTITLPLKHVSQQTEEVTKNVDSEEVLAVMDDVETDREYSDDKPLALVIDDNKDIREMITTLMQEDYNITTAPNGKEGIRKASKYVPDLIICDVMMPGIDGMETCKRLKEETVTSHIPVLMLTACSLDEQRVQGFDSGADGYLSKPFSGAVLKAQSASLIANRKRIKDVLGQSAPDKRPAAKTENTKSAEHGVDVENDFYNKFLHIFEKNMSNPDFNVEGIASELGFERTQLYRKIKAITNYSPVELMRNLRLKKARTLLTTTDKSISEICYEVGFSTPAYFTKCYKEQYGETPSETRSST